MPKTQENGESTSDETMPFYSPVGREDVTYTPHRYHPRPGECHEQRPDPPLAWTPNPRHVFHLAHPRSLDRRDWGAGTGRGHPDRLYDGRWNGGLADCRCAPRVDRRRCQRERCRGCRWAPGLRDSRMLRCGANSTTSHERDRDLRSLDRGDRFPVREVLALEIRDDVPHDLLGDRRHASVGQGLSTLKSRPHTEPPVRLLGPVSTETRTIATTSAAQSADELNRSYWSRWRKWRRGAETAGLPLEERPCCSP